MADPTCLLTEVDVTEAFLAATPLINQEILDLSIKHPNWARDFFDLQPWPKGQGTTMSQIVFRAQMPQIERGFSKWAKQANNTGCAPCEGPNCSYNWTPFGGTGLERKITELMDREFRTPAYCVKEIQTTANFQEVFAKIVQNIYVQTDFFKEMNIGLNFLQGLAKKYVVDSEGAKPNPQNPYVYRNIGTARISMLNIEILEFFYEYMRRDPSAVPYDVIDGAPIFSIMCSGQLLARLYRDNNELRQDVRFSGLANDLVLKYNFMSTIRGMFIAAPILYPRRFIIVNGEPVEVLPFVNDIPMEVGSFTGLNGAYQEATHEEVLLHGQHPFKVFYNDTVQSLGANSSFGPEFSFMQNWQWVNPMTDTDPFRRVGFFATAASIGLSQQYSDALYGILVERPSNAIMGSWLPAPECPPDDPDCDNTVPATLCPCPLILGAQPDPFTAGQYNLELATPIDAEAEDEIQFGIDTGGYVTGEVTQITADGKIVGVTFADTFDPGLCDRFTTIFCDNTLGCYSSIAKYNGACLDNTRIDLYLENPIKADTAADAVIVYFGDGTSANATVISADMLSLKWVVDLGSTVFCDQSGGVVGICVPPSTDASCPACGGPTYVQCET